MNLERVEKEDQAQRRAVEEIEKTRDRDIVSNNTLVLALAANPTVVAPNE